MGSYGVQGQTTPEATPTGKEPSREPVTPLEKGLATSLQLESSALAREAQDPELPLHPPAPLPNSSVLDLLCSSANSSFLPQTPSWQNN